MTMAQFSNPEVKNSLSHTVGPESLTVSRKDDHIKICLTENVQSGFVDSWDSVNLPHMALPEIDFSEIQLKTTFLGKTYDAPFLISSMTGGSTFGNNLNFELARFAERVGIPMGLGSQRYLLENPEDTHARDLRKKAPRASLWANIGAVQLNYGVTADNIKRLVNELEADALIVHCNPLQEAIQLEGDKNFSNIWKKLEVVCKAITVPMILKETGCGLDPISARRAVETGFAAIDIAGLGGTHWGFIEGLRSPSRRKLGETFRNWGRPTTQALIDCRKGIGPSFPVIASGGIRSGLDMARAFKLGANFCGLALPFLTAAKEGPDALNLLFEQTLEELRVALFCCGRTNPEELKSL